MKKLLFTVFAHPDDESFGPGATLIAESKAGTEIHLISLTAGEAGMNPDKVDDLKSTRLDEWRRAAKTIGDAKPHYLGFCDGKLNNTDMLKAADKIANIIESEYKKCEAKTEIELLTNDLNGLSGHIDHIVAGRAACLVFYKLKAAGLPMKKLRLFCMSQRDAPETDVSWLYMEPGRTDDEIDEIVDARQYLDQTIELVRCHTSQRSDGENHIESRGERLAVNHFIVFN